MEHRKPIFIAGPCVIESREVMEFTAQTIAEIATRLGVEIYFKASFDKANRTSLHSYRGVGIEPGIALLDEIKQRYNLPIITDIHEAWQADVVASVANVIQIPALLSRQTDLIVADNPTSRLWRVALRRYGSPSVATPLVTTTSLWTSEISPICTPLPLP